VSAIVMPGGVIAIRVSDRADCGRGLRGDVRVERDAAVLIGTVYREGVVDVAQRNQHGLAVVERRFGLLRLRQMQIRH